MFGLGMRETRIWTEILVLGFCTTVFSLLSITRVLPIEVQAFFVVIMVATVIGLAWWQFDGGMHPAFFFLGLLLIFQCGRLIASWFDAFDPFHFELGTRTPFDISPESQTLTLLVILISAVTIYVVSLMTYKKVTFMPPRSESLRPFLLLIFISTFPLHLYKNYSYLHYVMTHGGYIALYLDNGEHFQSVGSGVRVASQLCSASFLVYFLSESRKRWLTIVTLVYLSVTAIELLIGLRGKTFLLIITLMYLYKIKTGGRFKLIGITVLTVSVALTSVIIGSVRENKQLESTAAGTFLRAQGTSMQVTEAAIEFHDHFAPHALSYVTNQSLLAFSHQNSFGEGQLFENDLGLFLDPAQFAMGYGTASSYLAEAYLLGRIPGVIVVSFLIGVTLAFLHRSLNGWLVILTTVATAEIAYLPRSGLLEPVLNTAKTGISLLIVLVIAIALRAICNLALPRHYESLARPR